MDRHDRQQLTATITDIRRWAEECTRIRYLQANMPVSGRSTLSAEDEHALAMIEAAEAQVEQASALQRPAWLSGRNRDPATAAMDRVNEGHRAAMSRFGSAGLAEIVDCYEQRMSTEVQQLQSAVQDLRHWRIQAADAQRLVAHLPISGRTALQPAEQQVVRLVESVRVDVETASQLVNPASPVNPSDFDAFSQAAQVVVNAHDKIVSAHGPDHIDQIRRRYLDCAAAERRTLAAAVEDLRIWAPQARDVRQLTAHLPISGPISLEPEEASALSLVERTQDDVETASLLVASADRVGDGDFAAVSAAARLVTDAHEQIVSSFGRDKIKITVRRYSEQATSERRTVEDAMADLHRWRQQAAEVREICSHLPMSGSIDLEAGEQQLLTLVDRQSADLDAAAPLTRPLRFPSPLDFDNANRAARRVVKTHRGIVMMHTRSWSDVLQQKYVQRAATEREQVNVALHDLRRVRALAHQALHVAEHLPLTPASDVLEVQLRGDLVGLVETFDQNNEAAGGVADGVVCDSSNCSLAHNAADLLVRVHALVAEDGLADAAASTARRLETRTTGERSRVSSLLADLSTIRAEGRALLDDAEHLPIRRPDVVGGQMTKTVSALIDRVDAHHATAAQLRTADACAAGTCAGAHAAAVDLAAAHAAAKETDLLAQIRQRRATVGKQAIDDRTQLAALSSQLGRWNSQVHEIRTAQAQAAAVIRECVAAMMGTAVRVVVGGARLELAPLGDAQRPMLAALRMLKEQPITKVDDGVLGSALALALDLQRISADLGQRWTCDRHRCGNTHKTLSTVSTQAASIQSELDRLKPVRARHTESFDILIDPAYGLARHLRASSWPTDLLDPGITADICAHATELAFPRKAAEAAAGVAKAVAVEVRADDVASALKAMDLDVLRKASTLKVRIQPLAAAGLENVWDVLEFSHSRYLEELPGLGETSAINIEQAALRLQDAVRDETPVRVDVKKRGDLTTRLLEALRMWDMSRRDAPTVDETVLAKAFVTLSELPTPPKQVLVVADVRVDSAGVAALEREHLGRRFPELESDIWEDFLSRPADYFGMLSELGFVIEDEKKMHGDLPDEIIEAVRAKALKHDFLNPRLSLRAYQSFGARFVLVQKKAVIGDEMGLGKTIEALTVLAHLRATGQTHFVVVCPAAVVSNWVRETTQHTTLRAHRLQGGEWDRTAAAKSWIRNGGVAVITYDLLAWGRPFFRQADISCAVFDEAHYIKNPNAKRSLEAQDLIDRVNFAMLMTGTPLENSVQEFRNIISYIRPGLADSAPDYLPSKFRKHVAPAYLRRNQEDVLTELPELVEVDESLTMSTTDLCDYKSAVESSNFMLMRRAAMLSSDSAKLHRLVDIVAEAEANGRRVLVFSYFREVLDAVARTLPGSVFGPLTGSVPAAQRQVLVDEFSRAANGAVLVAQIGAGGVGLNIQSASIVVICEPQLKPTTEDQAIARAHRMGQTTTVQVHRLITENSVDERIREILADKRVLFDNFARDSVIAEQAPDAVDVSDSELARLVVAAERERLLGQR